jgi:glycosyltransferase involved in cell wall biosynthesis
MASGCCCIANNIKPLDEFMVDNVNGRLVTAGNPDDLAGAIIELLSDPPKRSRLGAEAAITASKLFSPELAAHTLQGLYLSVIDSTQKRLSPV